MPTSCIAVHASQYIVDTKIGDDNGKEGTPLKYLLVIIVHVEKYDYLCSGNYY